VGVGCSGAGRKCAPHVRRSWLRIDEGNTHHVGLGRAARVVRALLAQGPDALRPAVVRYAGRGAHTRPRVDHRMLSSPQQLRQAHHLLLQHLRVILDLRRVRLLLQLSRRRTVHGTLVAGCRLRMRKEQCGLLSRPRSFGSLQSLLKLARKLSLGLRRLQPCRGVGCAASHWHVAAHRRHSCAGWKDAGDKQRTNRSYASLRSRAQRKTVTFPRQERAPSGAARGRDCRAWSAGRMATEGRRVLLVIDSSTRRVVSTRPLRPASLDADAMLAEYMAYQSLVRIKGTSHAWHRTHTSRRMAAGDVGA